MTAWKPIETAPRDRPILVRGGMFLENRSPYSRDYSYGKCEGPVAVCGEDRTGWGLLLNKTSRVQNPTEWAEIPE